MSSGTQGRFSGVPEYELNLAVAQKLRDVLIEKGYNVVMIRETNSIDISNAERAEIANKIPDTPPLPSADPLSYLSYSPSRRW